MKQIYQYRYYGTGENAAKNQPNGSAEHITAANLISGSVFSKRCPILQLGVQSLPGTKFYLNNSIEPIIIGSTGIYELDLNEEAEISSIRFDSESINKIATSAINNYYLIVDIVYEDGEE